MPSTAPRTSTGFVSLGDYLNANQPAVQSTAGGLMGDATAAANKARTEADQVGQESRNGSFNNPSFDPTTLADYTQAQGDISSAQQKGAALGNYGGLSDAISQKYGPSTQGNNSLDANLQLANGTGQQSANQFSALGGYLDNAATSGMAQGGVDTARANGFTAPNGKRVPGTGINYSPGSTPSAYGSGQFSGSSQSLGPGFKKPTTIANGTGPSTVTPNPAATNETQVDQNVDKSNAKADEWAKSVANIPILGTAAQGADVINDFWGDDVVKPVGDWVVNAANNVGNWFKNL